MKTQELMAERQLSINPFLQSLEFILILLKNKLLKADFTEQIEYKDP